MLPAYIANASAVFFGANTPTPIDRGVFWRKNRLLGDGKTYEGLFGGIICGFLSGIIQNQFALWLGVSPSLSFGLFPYFVVTLFCLSAGAMLGDMLGSFAKRRAGIEKGTHLPLVDQLDFVFGAWLFLFLFSPDWFIKTFSMEIIITVILITPLLHLLTNYIGFKIGKKEVPW
jgi:CDP-2,3-bis-(O-geranylgeranyl)-sn-glycerol synthase